MPWVRARLRDALVFARANDRGALEPSDGKVEIRYRPNDGRRYFARATNLEVVDPTPLPDDTCSAASSVPKRRGADQSDGAEAHVAYTDGACSGNPGPAGLGVVLFSGNLRKERSEWLGHATNNIAELTAVLRALEMSPPNEPLTVYTDSSYAIGVLSKNWKAKANAELIGTIRRTMQGRDVTLVYVRGHAGNRWNERADELARMAIQTQQTTLTERVDR